MRTTPQQQTTMTTQQQRASATSTNDAEIPLKEPCSICGTRESAVRARRNSKPLCVLHYFTTTAPHRRKNAPPHTILDPTMVDEQTPEVQRLFAQAIDEIRRDMEKQKQQKHQQQRAKQSPHTTSTQLASQQPGKDPLAILHQWHGGKPKKKKSVPTGGGFLRPAPLPPDLLRTQHEQRRKHDELTKRISDSTMTSDTKPPPVKRRKRESVWNVVNPYQPPSTDTATNDSLQDGDALPGCTTCGARGSSSAVVLVHTTQRKHDMGKAETWSNKDRDDDVISTYRCNTCGKQWKEHD